MAGEREVTFGNVAAELGLSESTVKWAVHRLRERYPELVREESARTISDPAEIDAESGTPSLIIRLGLAPDSPGAAGHEFGVGVSLH